MTTAGCTVFCATFVAVRWSSGRRDFEEINRLIIVFTPVRGKILYVWQRHEKKSNVENEASMLLDTDGRPARNLIDVARKSKDGSLD